jgi:hypothetical protein
LTCHHLLSLSLCLSVSLSLSLSVSLCLSLSLSHFALPQSRFSSKLKGLLLSFGPNVQVLRHSNKANDGTPLWHNERVVIVDRCEGLEAISCLPPLSPFSFRKVAFIGSTDLEFGRYDDLQHLLEDEDGLVFPGPDYCQYTPSLHPPARSLTIPTERERHRTKSSLGMPLPCASLGLSDSLFPLLSGSPIPVVEAEATTANATYANVSVEADGNAHNLDSSTHSVVYPLEAGGAGSMQHLHESQYRFGDGEDYGSPETEQEAMARLEAENFAQGSINLSILPPCLLFLAYLFPAIPFHELDVVSERRDNAGGFMSGLLGWFGQLGELLEDVMNTTTRGDANRRPNRELFPRQPFHDLQIKLTGVAARDVSSYFVQVSVSLFLSLSL